MPLVPLPRPGDYSLGRGGVCGGVVSLNAHWAHSQGCSLSCLWTACKNTHLRLEEGLVSEYRKGLGFVTGESASWIFGELALGSLGVLVERANSWASVTEDEMVGWHHQLNGHEFEQAPGVGDGQGGLAYCSPWGHKESDTTEGLNWTELNAIFPLKLKSWWPRIPPLVFPSHTISHAQRLLPACVLSPSVMSDSLWPHGP